MTGMPPPRPLLPVLARMALGLSLAALGGVLAWQGVTFRPTPGLATVQTPLEVPLDGPGPGDLASAANLRFESDRSSIHLAPLRRQSPALLRGEATLLAGKLRHDPKKVEEGRRMVAGEV